jgi:hypothetical protein
VSVPTGAEAELHDPLPFDRVAVQSGVNPVEKVTEPLGENPVTFVITVAE